MKNINLTALFYKINKIRRSKEVELRDTLKHEKETLLPFRALSISLFFISLIEGILRFAIILTKDSETTYEVLYKERGVHPSIERHSHDGFKKYHARVRLFTATTGLVIVMTSSLAGLAINFATGVYQTALAATFSWTQSDWTTLTSNTTGYPAPANWTEYAATSTNIVGGTTLSLSTISTSVTQTSDADFNAGTQSTTVVSGGGAGASVVLAGTSIPVNAWDTALKAAPGAIAIGSNIIRNGADDTIYVTQGGGTTGFYKYTISTNMWTTLAVVPGALANGSNMIRNGADDTIYVTQGNSTTGFYKYTISTNTWTSLTAIPGSVYTNSSMISNGADDTIYVTQGGGNTGFYKYTISTNTWTSLAVNPGVGAGSRMIRNGADDTIYVTQGNSTTGFYRYTISTNTWTTLAVAPGALSDGSSMIRNGADDTIYVTRGNMTANFYKYTISTNAWTSLAITPGPLSYGSSMIRNGANDTIYVTQATSYTSFYKYTISTNTWTSLAAIPGGPYTGSSMISNGADDTIYVTQGNSTTGFYKYTISTNTWAGSNVSSLAATPGTLAQGSNMIRNGADDTIYVTQGNSATGFYRYTISTNTWTTLAVVPGALANGSNMIRNGADDTIYVTRGNGTTGFYKYTISTNTWTTLAVVPGILFGGSNMIRNGADDTIYVTQGNSATGFYRYTISTNTWTTLTVVPGALNNGSDMIRNGADDTIYVTQCGNLTGFYKYTISTNTWMTLAVAPGTLADGSSMIRNGADDTIYVTRGGSNTGFYKYTISTNTWTTLAVAPGALSNGSSMIRNGADDTIYVTQSTGNTGFYKFIIQTAVYSTLGTFTSSVLDSLAGQGSISYSLSTPANTTASIDVRAGDTLVPDGSWTAWQTGVLSGGSISGLGVHRYVQYRANFGTTNTATSPTLSDVTIVSNRYPSGQTLTSSKFDTGNTANLMGGTTWNEDATLPAGTYVAISLRASSTAATVASTDWATLSSTSTGCSKSGTTVTCLSSALPSSVRDGMDDQWFQYMITLSSSGASTPSMADLTISYVMNLQPELQNVTAAEQTDGTVLISYDTRDPDATFGTFTPGTVLPSFEYSTNSGGTWTPIVTGLSADATTSKAVSELTWNTYTTVWDAKSTLNGVFSSTTQVRVTVNDGELAKNTAALASLAFPLDEKNPAFGAIPLIIQATYSPALATINASDDSAMEMKLGRMPDLSDAIWVPFASSSTITLVAEPDTVYLQLRDAHANETAITAVTTPNTPVGVGILDLSNDLTFRLFISWGVTPVPGPGFGAYRIYRSVAGGPYELYRTITNRMDNYILDDNGGAMLDTNLTYYYKLYVDDANGNTSYYSPVVSDAPNGQSVDSTPPTITGESATTTTQGATISWTTSELADSSVGFCVSPCSDYSLTQGVTSYVTNHEVSITGLTPGQTYDYVVTSRDPSGNLASSTPLSFTTRSGALIANVAVIRASNTNADISWDTNIAANANVVYAMNTPPTGGIEFFTGMAAYLTTHKVTLEGLIPGQTYYFYVQSTDEAGNLAEDKNVVNGVKEYYKFNTSDDLSAPIITNVATGTVIDIAAVISWDTDEAANGTVEWGTTTGIYASSTVHTTYDMSHFIQIDGLTPLTPYYYRVSSADQNGNIATSTEYSFTTKEQSFGEADRVVQLVVYASARQPDGVAQVLYDEAKKALQDAQDALALRTDELAQKTTELATAVKELTDIKTEIFGLRADETTDPKAILRIVSEKFSALTKSFEGSTSLNLTEGELTPAMKTLRELAQAVPPPIIRGAPEVVIGANMVSIAWTSDKETNSMIALAKKDEFDSAREDPYKQEFGKAEIYEMDHKVTLENLLPSTEYHFQIRSTSQLGTKVRTRDYTFVTPVELPEITNASVAQLEGGKVRFAWHTNVLTNSAVRYTPYVNGKPMESRGDTFGKSDYVNDHAVILEQLKSGTTYGIELLSTDPHGNTARRDMANYTTGKDIAPPEITQVRTDITVFPGAGNKIQVIVFWGTDELSTSQVLYDEGVAGVEGTEPALSTSETIDMGTKHTIVIANWKPNTVYRFRVASTDASGNRAESKDFTVKTPQQKASIIDIIIANFSSTFGWTKNIGL